MYALQCRVYGAGAKISHKSGKELTSLRGRMSREREKVITCDKQYRASCESLGETHPQTLDALSELATAYEKASEHEKAVQLHTRVNTLRSEALGETHQDAVAAKRKLAHAYASRGNCEKALQLYELPSNAACSVKIIPK